MHPIKSFEDKSANKFSSQYQIEKMNLKKTMSTYCHNIDHMTLQLNYKECDHDLDPSTTSFKMNGLNYEITLMKLFSETSYIVQNHLHAHQYSL
jgi:hypothetical protein